ncbi:DNA-directed RNA polymerase subunit omega [Thermodesulforhabdus norvegica]|uniref:DNA-directed RNA polymerase subunit omega n=1 Tax=Thermodesulforhabdus norvegica TaxID=39841 RepID=A0A1I4UVJ3_9BACT|nr:DNA-directed RNA polymerase subunit omega [Thermodesulforhabdus norvegica]SFM93037.1 DNA-directed RNA polymerase subunit omega [Thermodesulforhabdus norvegica]
MARVTIEDCMRQIDSRFALIHLAVRRVLQLRRGAKPLVHAPKNKEIVLALREIAAGKVTLENIDLLEKESLELIPGARAEEVKAAREKQAEIQQEFESVAALGAVRDKGEGDGIVDDAEEE